MYSSPRWQCAEQREQVGLRAARREQAGFEPEVVREAFLQRDDGGIFAVDVVADFGVEHRFAHGAA